LKTSKHEFAQDALEKQTPFNLDFRPAVRLVERGSLPRFELKARRFHIQR
jgi:phenylacetate-coenzyme A ligase PaaK-like adenylate-forming protein